jgi:hypothetical protein
MEAAVYICTTVLYIAYRILCQRGAFIFPCCPPHRLQWRKLKECKHQLLFTRTADGILIYLTTHQPSRSAKLVRRFVSWTRRMASTFVLTANPFLFPLKAEWLLYSVWNVCVSLESKVATVLCSECLRIPWKQSGYYTLFGISVDPLKVEWLLYSVRKICGSFEIRVTTLFRRPSLWSSGQSSWLQIRRSVFDSRHYQKKK